MGHVSLNIRAKTRTVFNDSLPKSSTHIDEKNIENERAIVCSNFQNPINEHAPGRFESRPIAHPPANHTGR